MSSWCMRMMSTLLTARMRSPTCSLPHRSAGLPSIIRPVMCKIDVKVKGTEMSQLFLSSRSFMQCQCRHLQFKSAKEGARFSLIFKCCELKWRYWWMLLLMERLNLMAIWLRLTLEKLLQTAKLPFYSLFLNIHTKQVHDHRWCQNQARTSSH